MIFAKVDSKVMDNGKVVEFGGPKVGTKSGPCVLNTLINIPEAWVGVEDFMPMKEFHWAFHYNEVHLVLDGKAEISYTLAANPDKIINAVAEKGDTYFIPCGARVSWKVISKEPFRHYFAIQLFDLNMESIS